MSDSKFLEHKIVIIYEEYKTLFNLNFVEFGNKSFSPYMHLICHIPDLIIKYGKFSIFNCQGFRFNNIKLSFI